MARLSVTFLGTSSATPTESRGMPSVMVQREGELLLFDCGEGAQRQLLKYGPGLNRDTAVLITHLHGDHVTGILGLLQTMSLAQRTRELTIVGPSDLSKWLELTSEILHIGLTFEVRFVPARRGAVLKRREYTVRCEEADHSIEAYSYLLEEKQRPGEFHPERARALGIPEGRLWSRLQKGRAVLYDGRKIAPREVVGPPRQGRRVGYSGDTRPTSRLTRFFNGCDLLVFDSTFSTRDRDKAVERKHSTAAEAASLALACGAKTLVLTHFSARYKSVSQLVREARSIFPNTLAARDGLRIDVGYPDS